MAEDKVAFLRLLISDVSQDSSGNTIFTDKQLNVYLESAPNIYFAAAFALRAIAADQVLILKWVRTDDLTIDGPSVSKELRLLALDYENQGLRELGNSGDNYGVAISFPKPRFNGVDLAEGTELPWPRW